MREKKTGSLKMNRHRLMITQSQPLITHRVKLKRKSKVNQIVKKNIIFLPMNKSLTWKRFFRNKCLIIKGIGMNKMFAFAICWNRGKSGQHFSLRVKRWLMRSKQAKTKFSCRLHGRKPSNSNSIRLTSRKWWAWSCAAITYVWTMAQPFII